MGDHTFEDGLGIIITLLSVCGGCSFGSLGWCSCRDSFSYRESTACTVRRLSAQKHNTEGRTDCKSLRGPVGSGSLVITFVARSCAKPSQPFYRSSCVCVVCVVICRCVCVCDLLTCYVLLWRIHRNTNSVFRLVYPAYDTNTYVFKVHAYTDGL